MRTPPAWAALGLAGLVGIASAAQTAVNAALAGRLGSAVLAATASTVVGAAAVAAVALAQPSGRAGLQALRRTRPPWWTYLGGVGGAVFVTGAAYAAPVLGVAVFTVAQVAGSGLGGLGVDRAGLAPVGRLALTGPRVAGAGLGVAAVVVSQLGRPVGDLPAGPVAVAVLGGLAVAAQGALNGRLAAASSPAAGTLVNFAVNLPLMLLAAAVLGLLGPPPSGGWPGDWYLYLGGLLGGGIVAALVFTVRAVGVLRTGLAVVAGQLAGALLLDTALPGGPGLSAGALVGAALTVVAVVVAGRGTRPACGPAIPDDRRAGTLGR